MKEIFQKVTTGKKPNIYEIFYFCLFPVFPLIYSSDLIDPVLIPRQVYLTSFLLVLGLIILGERYLHKTAIDFSFIQLALPVIFLIFLFFVLISYAQASVKSESIYVFSKYLAEFMFFIITIYLIANDKLRIGILVKSVFFFSVVVVLIALYQLTAVFFTDQFSYLTVTEIQSTLANKNLLSSALFLTGPFLIFITYINKLWRIIGFIQILVVIILLWLVQTKSVLIAGFIFIFIFIILNVIFRKKKIKKTVNRSLLIIASIFVITASIITIHYKEAFINLYNTKSVYSRLLIWKNSSEMIKDNAVFGVGAGNWKIQFPKYGLDKHNDKIKNGTTIYQRPHNDFIWILSETGILGLISYILIFIISLFYLFRILKIPGEEKDKPLYTAFFACIIGYVFIASVDFPLERIEHQTVLLLIFSVITVKYYKSYKVGKLKSLKFNFFHFLVFFFLSIIFSGLVSLKRYNGEYHTQKLIKAHHNSNWKNMIKESDKSLNAFLELDPMSVPIEWYKGVAQFTLGNINQAKISFENAYELSPYNIHVLNNLASCYEKTNNNKKAEQLYRNALEISSGFEEARLNLSAVYYNNKQYEKAFQEINQCNIDSRNEKYKTFLPVILSAKINMIIENSDIKIDVNKLNNLKKSNSKLLELYFKSKKENLNFEELIITNIK